MQLPAGSNTGVAVSGNTLIAPAGLASAEGQTPELVAYRLGASGGGEARGRAATRERGVAVGRAREVHMRPPQALLLRVSRIGRALPMLRAPRQGTCDGGR